MKILINTPDYRRPSSGGVASFYYGMIGYWTEVVQYNIVGRRRGVSGTIWMPWDITKFSLKILFQRPGCVLLNPSLGKNAMRRDFLFLHIARLLRTPVVVLIHGFNLDYAKQVDKKWIRKNLNCASLVMVLADQFRQILKSWGVVAPVELTTTKVEDRMIEDFDISTRNGVVKNILFLSRMERAKGVYETIDTFALLKAKHQKLTLTMVGDGSELKKLREYVAERDIQGVTFTGALDGAPRLKAYRDANFFFFFTSYGEGMPTVVLEAMAFGLPVLTRYVGGLCDFFEDGRMGRITESLQPEEFVRLLEPYLTDKRLTKDTSIYNHQYALQHFMASKVGKNMERLISNHI